MPIEPANQILTSEPVKKSFYSFVQLDPRPGATNPPFGFGVEITEPRLMPAGIVNLNHHGEGSTVSTPSAAEQALHIDLPEENTVIAGLKMDKDTLTAMAILESRKAGRVVNEDIVKAVGAVDRFGIQVIKQYETYQDLILALDRKAVETKLPLAERVKFAQSVLDGTVNADEVKQMVADRNREFVQAKAESKITELVPGKLVLVESSHRYASNLAYEVAPTFIAYNSKMPVMAKGDGAALKPTSETYEKYTIARYDDHVQTDIQTVLKELQQAEADARGIDVRELKNNWGGRGDIIGSPQNESSKLTVDQVTEIVKHHVKTDSLPAVTGWQEVKEVTPQEAAEMLYDMGFRLSNSLDIQLIDTSNSIELTNVYASVLNYTWADGEDRDTERFASLLGIPPEYHEEVADYLHKMTKQKPRRGDPKNLIGLRDANSFLVDKQIRKNWGDFTCFTALVQAGGEPWEWMPTEMMDAVTNNFRLDLHSYIDTQDRRHTTFFEAMSRHPQTVSATVKLLLEGNGLRYPDDVFMPDALKFMAYIKENQPKVVEQIVGDASAKKSIDHPNIFFRSLGDEYVQKWADVAFPNRNKNLFNWEQYQRELCGVRLNIRDGKLVSDDGTISLEPPYPLFSVPDISGQRGYPEYEFATPELIQEAINDAELHLGSLKEKVASGEQSLVNLKKLHEEKTVKV